MSKPKILLIDDSEEIHLLVRRTLADIGEVISAYQFSEAVDKFSSDNFAIVIIDLNLDKDNGMDLLKEFKSTPTETRFFIMTGKDSENDELMGHTYGVHEYIKKPFNREILKAIVLKNLKIRGGITDAEVTMGPLKINPDKFKATMMSDKGEEELQLTIKEFRLLLLLVSHPDRAFSREELFSQVWESDSDSTFRTIDMHVSSLRKKLGSLGQFIKTVHQIGYKFIQP